MSAHDRREFLRKLAKTAAYAAPVVVSLAAPIELVGQGDSPSKKEGHWHPPGQGSPTKQTLPPNPQPGGPPPWQQPPPGSRRP